MLYLSPKQRHRKCAIYRGEGGAGDATADASNAAALADSFADAANASAGQAATSASAAEAAKLAAQAAQTAAELAETNAETAETNAEAVLTDAGFIVVAADLQGTDTIGTVATDIANVNAVGNNIANVNTVAGISADVTTVAADGTDIGLVAASITDVNDVADNILDVTAVADNETNIDTVAGISANVTTVAGIAANVTTVAGVSSNVTTVAGISANVTTVAGISSDVTTVATNNTNVSTVATNIASVNTNATNIVAIQNASANAISAADSASAAAISAASAAASFDAFDDIYLGAKASNPTVDNDGDPLTTGDQYFNTVANELRVWNGSSWQAASVIGGTVDSINVNNVATFSAGTVSAPAITTTGDTNTGIYFPAADTIAFTEGGVESMRITNIGDLVMGQAGVLFGPSNAKSLELNASGGSAICLNNNGSLGTYLYQAGAAFSIVNTQNSSFAFGTNSTERMRITSTGNVGIGTSSPSAPLEVVGNTVVFSIKSANDGGSSYMAYKNTSGTTLWDTGIGTTIRQDEYTIRRAGSVVMYMSNTSNVGIGTSLPQSVLNVFGASGITLNLASTSWQTAAIKPIDEGASFKGSLAFYTHPSSGSTISPTERMRIDSSGNVLVGITSARANAGDVQVSKGISFPATQSAQSDANTLDDYEEGTFTPTIVGDGTAGTTTYTVQLGSYTKIGKVLNFKIDISWTNQTGTGSLIMGGLPFTSANDSFISVCAIRASNLTYTAGASLSAQVQSNSTSMYPVQSINNTIIATIPVDTSGQLSISGFYFV